MSTPGTYFDDKSDGIKKLKQCNTVTKVYAHQNNFKQNNMHDENIILERFEKVCSTLYTIDLYNYRIFVTFSV